MKERLDKILKYNQKIQQEGNIGFISALLDVDDRQEEMEKEFSVIQKEVERMGESLNEEHDNVYDKLLHLEQDKLSKGQLEALKPILKGDKGDNYNLTEKDKKDIAKQVTPTKEITKIIKEQIPINKREIIDGVLSEITPKLPNKEEIAQTIPIRGVEVRDALEMLPNEEKLTLDATKEYPEIKKDIKSLKDRLDNFNLPALNETMTPSGSSGLEKILSSGEVIRQGVSMIDFGSGLTVVRQGNGVRVDATGGVGGAVDSVNGQTGVVVLDTGDIAEATDLNYVSDAQLVVIGNTSGTNTGDNAVNSNYSGLVTNATHTGEVTGSGALTVDKTAITNKTEVTAAVGDYVLVADASDSSNLKKVTVQTITDLAAGSGVAESLAIAYAVAL